MKRLLPVLLLAVGGCATHLVHLQPWQGVPADQVEALKRGEFSVSKDKLFDAAATTLEHEPYLHWQISTLDRANGLVKADAGLLREVQLRVADADNGGSKLAISVPRRELKTRIKVYIKKSDPAERTAYVPEEAKLRDYKVVSADVQLDDDYFRAFAWHVLNDRAQVPFRLRAYPLQPEQAEPAAAAAPTPAPTPVAVNEGPRLPVRADAVGNTWTAVPEPAPSTGSGQAHP